MNYSEFLDDKKKHNQKEKEEKIFNLYFPCYDILNKEIYFFNFFNEEIINMKSIDLFSKEVVAILMNQDTNIIKIIIIRRKREIRKTFDKIRTELGKNENINKIRRDIIVRRGI